MAMAFIFYLGAGVGSILFCAWYMKRFWSDERLARLERAETAGVEELGLAEEPEGEGR